jgi:hypothetical protein
VKVEHSHSRDEEVQDANKTKPTRAASLEMFSDDIYQKVSSRVQRPKAVILTSWEVEIGRIMV